MCHKQLRYFFYILQYPVHNTLELTEKEATKSYITSFFRSRYERVYDSPPSLVMEVDETTVDPTDSGVHRSPTPPAQHSSPAASRPAASPSHHIAQDVMRIERKIDDLTIMVRAIIQHLGIEVHNSITFVLIKIVSDIGEPRQLLASQIPNGT